MARRASLGQCACLLNLPFMKNSLLVFVLVATLIVPSFVQAAGETDVVNVTSSRVTVAWNKSPDQDVKGYRLYYGLSSGRDYPKSVDVGNVTTHTFSDLTSGSTYYCVVKAYNAAGKESLASNEISFCVSRSASRPQPDSANLGH